MHTSAQVVSALALGAALLVIASGAAKVRDPQPAAAMLAGLRPPGWHHLPHRALVRLAGLVEIGVGVAVATVGGRFAAMALAVVFLAFTAVVVTALARGSRASCGCFGTSDAPLGRAQLGVDLVGVAIAVAAVIEPPARFGGLGAAAGLPAAVLAVQVLLLGWLAYLTITALPSLAAARRRLLEDP